MTLPFFSTLCPHHSSSRTFLWPRMDSSSPIRQKEKVIIIMGPTGAGKTSLSIDLATHYFPSSEIINFDKIQLYKGLDITTNKIPVKDRNGIPHHLLGEVDPLKGDFTPSHFRHVAASIISDITSRNKVPILVGGSNSYVHALLCDRFDPELTVFDESNNTNSISRELRYECCFLWVDVEVCTLLEYLNRRVDDMIEMGMVDELAEFFDPDSDDLEVDSENRTGLRKAIGVAEFDGFFKRFPPRGGGGDRVREGACYEDAVRRIKENTCGLVRRQMGKILRLREAGWDLRRVDATEAFKAKLGGGRWSEIWEREVVWPSVKIVNRFLEE